MTKKKQYQKRSAIRVSHPSRNDVLKVKVRHIPLCLRNTTPFRKASNCIEPATLEFDYVLGILLPGQLIKDLAYYSNTPAVQDQFHLRKL